MKNGLGIYKMKKLIIWISAVILAAALFSSVCRDLLTADTAESRTESEISQDQFTSGDPAQKDSSKSAEGKFSIADVAEYTDQPYVIVNDNIPFFSEDDLTVLSFEFYSDLDDLGRCGVAYANIGIEIMPTEERGEIGKIKPTGWHTVKYDIINDTYLYNRCHLIDYQLSGENANEKNLITGTRFFNNEGMRPFENLVADYVKETENHVLYRVTPVFQGDNLLASGVLMEAESVEDKGEGISFCVYVYNVQPGITIDYSNGESCIYANENKGEDETEEIEGTGTAYILNTNTRKFHYPICNSVNEMKESNKKAYIGDREDVISQGYKPCQRCKP